MIGCAMYALSEPQELRVVGVRQHSAADWLPLTVCGHPDCTVPLPLLLLLLLVAAPAAATDGTFDVKSLHGSCPTLKGTKYSATKW